MKNLCRIFSINELAGTSLDDLMIKIMDATGAEFIQVLFDSVAGKGFAGNVYKFKNNTGLTDVVIRTVTNWSLTLPHEEPIIFSGMNTPQWVKQHGINPEPFEQLINIPFNNGLQKIALTLCFFEKADDVDELIYSLQECECHITAAINRYKLECSGKEEKFLLAFSSVISNVKTRDQLLRAINYHLKNYLDFAYATLFVLDNDRTAVINYFQDSPTRKRESPFKQLIRIDTNNTTDHPAEIIAKEVTIADFDEISENHNIQLYLQQQNTGSDTNGTVMNLYHEDKVIAHLAVIFSNNYNPNQALLKIVANLLSTALLKLQAEEISNNREAESELLQSLNIDFASIRDKEDLLKIIHYKLKKLFEFGHHWLAVLNEDQLTMTSFLQDPVSQVKDHVKYQHMITAKYSTNDRVFNKVLLSKEAHIFDLDQLITRGNMPEYMIILHESGIKRVVMIGLQVGKRIIGVWAICLTGDQHINDKQLNLIKVISSQLSIAVDNIIANMAVAQKEAEREKILEFSFSLTSIRNRSHLLKVIKNSLKRIIGFGELVILVSNENSLNSSIFLNTMELPADVETPEAQKVRNAYFSKVVESDGIIVLYDQKISKECSTDMACISLKENNYNICLFFMYNNNQYTYTDHDLELIKGVAYQLSPAIANVLANEDIQNREKEKELLLAFSNAITSVRDKNVLAKILKKQLNDLFSIKDYIIHFLSDDKQKHMPLLFDPDADFAHYPDFKKLLNNWNNVNDGIFNKVLDSSDPVFFDIEQCFEQPGSPEYLKSAKAINQQQMIGVSIRLGQENIAVMNFIHNDYTRIVEQYHLFKCILSQIALSVSNIVANEKVNKQLEEINNYKHQLEEEKIYLKEEIETTLNYAEIVGESPVMQKVFRLVAQVAPSESTVLLLGETGTGKELIARAIHNNSPRKNKLMVKINCAALPANLIESELFGHEKGSFTGATERRLGKFELANNGTLFLDEIGEMPLDLQVKLLRALQEKEIERVGGNATIKVNVRIIAATNRDLEKEMLEGRFRRDLYYRLNIFPIELPPLRSRKEDIPLLAIYFIQRFAKKAGKEIITLNNRALNELVQYKWPGNIRELEHLIERSVLLATGDTIKQVHLPAAQQQPVINVEQEFIIKTIDEHERDAIIKTLKYCGGRIGGNGGAAMLLDLPTSTLNSKMKRLGIRKEHIIL